MKLRKLTAFSTVLTITAGILMSLVLVPFTSGTTVEAAYDYYDDSGIEVVAEVNGSVATIPETVDGIVVDYVDMREVVHDNSEIKELVLPSGLGAIYNAYDEGKLDASGKEIFDADLYRSFTPNCPNLSKVTVNPNNTYYKSVDGILYSKDGTALYYCPPGKSGNLVIPEGVTQIGAFAFLDCAKLVSITFPSTVRDINKAAFGRNTNLKKLYVASGNPYLKAVSDILFSADGETLFIYPSGKADEEYTIPNDVFTIASGAFMGNSYVTNITAATDLQSVGIGAFADCTALTSVEFTSKLLDVDSGAFWNCKNITSITFPYGTRSIGEEAFRDCNKLLTLKLPSSVTSLPDNLATVKNRKIYYYSPYVVSDTTIKAATGVIVYTYKGSAAEQMLKETGVKVRYYSKSYATVAKVGTAPKSAVTGKGKADTSWYNKKATTFKISNPDQLAGLAKLVNAGNTFRGKKIQLTKDLNLACYTNWMPIGMRPKNKLLYFEGEFDGKGHSIYNLRINRIGSSYLGLFGEINVSGIVKNLDIKKANVLGDSVVGILVGNSYGEISNCQVSGNVRGNSRIGGLVGWGSGITNCSSTATVRGIQYVGGIVGEAANELKESENMGSVNGLYYTGGIAGQIYARAVIKNCNNYYNVTGLDSIGGIVGDTNRLLSRFAANESPSYVIGCTNTASVTAIRNAGGIVGYLDSSDNVERCIDNVEQCINVGIITGDRSIGGLVGGTYEGNIKNSTNEGHVTGGSCVGGILGEISGNKYDNIIKCVNQGTIRADRYGGDLIGNAMSD